MSLVIVLINMQKSIQRLFLVVNIKKKKIQKREITYLC